jgi:hypothetical protein
LAVVDSSQPLAVSDQRKTLGAVRLPTEPLAWIGEDRVLLNDLTTLGMRRKVFARQDDVPNVVGLLQAAFEEARDAKVHWWLIGMPNGFIYLWIIWKKE